MSEIYTYAATPFPSDEYCIQDDQLSVQKTGSRYAGPQPLHLVANKTRSCYNGISMVLRII